MGSNGSSNSSSSRNIGCNAGAGGLSILADCLNPTCTASASSSTFGCGAGVGAPGQYTERDKKKKARTTFTGRQIFELERQFEEKKYLSSNERTELAAILHVTETQVCANIWWNYKCCICKTMGETK